MKKAIKIPNKMGRKEKDFSAKSSKVYLYLPNSVLVNWNAARIKQTILDIHEGKASLIYAERPKTYERLEIVDPQTVMITSEIPMQFIETKPIEASKKINPIVAQLAASVKGVGTADKPIDRNSDRGEAETFQDFKARSLDYTPKPKVYSDRTQKAIDRLIRVYDGNRTINEGRNIIDDYLIKLNDDYDNASQ